MSKLDSELLNKIPDPVICFNKTGEITYANEIAKNVFSEKKLLKKNIADYLPIPEGFNFEGFISLERNIALTASLGEKLYEFTISGNSKVNIGEIFGRDITDYKRKERALNLAIEQADEVRRLEEDFLAKVSHEIRSPLLVIEGYTELLMSEIDDDAKRRYEPFFFAINNSSKRLYRAFDLVLYNYQLQTRSFKPKLEKVNLFYLLSRLHQEFLSFAMEKKIEFLITFDMNEDPLINADPTSVEQIFVILLDNAFNFTSKGKIEINIDKSGDSIIVEIIDSGTGITAEYFDVLDKFLSGKSTADLRANNINGLGIETAKKFTELIDAKIIVKTEPEKGSTFTVVFEKYTGTEDEKEEESTSAKIFYLPTINKNPAD